MARGRVREDLARTPLWPATLFSPQAQVHRRIQESRLYTLYTALRTSLHCASSQVKATLIQNNTLTRYNKHLKGLSDYAGTAIPNINPPPASS
jgi:hypothetical protein